MGLFSVSTQSFLLELYNFKCLSLLTMRQRDDVVSLPPHDSFVLIFEAFPIKTEESREIAGRRRTFILPQFN